MFVEGAPNLPTLRVATALDREVLPQMCTLLVSFYVALVHRKITALKLFANNNVAGEYSLLFCNKTMKNTLTQFNLHIVHTQMRHNLNS